MENKQLVKIKRLNRVFIFLIVIIVGIYGFHFYRGNTIASTFSPVNEVDIYQADDDNSSKITDRVKYIPYKNIPVYLETNQKVTENEFKNFINQPEALLDTCKAVYVCDSTGNNTCTNTYNNNNFDESLMGGDTFKDSGGFSSYGNQTIYLESNDKKTSDYSLDRDVFTLFLAGEYDAVNKISYSSEWNQLYQSNPHALDERDNANIHLLFQAACLYYFNYPDDIKTKSGLPVYNFMQNLFHYYTSDNGDTVI